MFFFEEMSRESSGGHSPINLFFSIQLFENELMEEKLMSEGQMPQPAEIFFILFISLIINEIEKELKRLKAGGALQWNESGPLFDEWEKIGFGWASSTASRREVG